MTASRIWLATALLAGCGRPSEATPPTQVPVRAPSPGRTPAADAPPADAAAVLRDVESQLLGNDFHLAFSVFSEGVVTSSLVGEVWAQGDRLRIRANGTFRDEPIELRLDADGERVRGGRGGETTIDLAQPPELRRAVVIGLVRMGVLHNVARLVAGRPPDHAEGGVETWAVAHAPALGVQVEPTELSEGAAGQASLSFALQVAGEPAGEVSLWVDPAAGYPVERHQIVRFPEGEMRVREVYRRP